MISDTFHLNFLWVLGILFVGLWVISRTIRFPTGTRKTSPTPEEMERLLEASREYAESGKRQLREATEFKPGDLTPEEEELVRREGLNRLTYVPRKVIQAQAEAQEKYAEKMRKRAEIMSRPAEDPERVRLVAGESGQRMGQSLNDRFDGAGYGMFLFVIFGITQSSSHLMAWPWAHWVCLLMLGVLEFSYQWYKRH